MKINFQDNWIDRVGISAILIVSLFYVLFGSSFAQWRLEFSFLDFPIFIGEILLVSTSLLLIVKCIRQKSELGLLGWVLGTYIFFILLKAFTGYFAWGPLAFRDSALFYYPLFAVLGYSFWSQEFMGDNTRRLFFVVILAIFILNQYVSFWLFTLIILGIMLALKAKSLPEKMILIGAIVLFVPYVALCDVFSRTVFLSTLVSVIFIAVVFFFLFYKDRWGRIVGIVLGVLVLGAVLFNVGKTGVWKTFTFKDANPLVAAVPQVPDRGKYLFHPVGSSPEKPDAIKQFFQNISMRCSLMGKIIAFNGNKSTPRIQQPETIGVQQSVILESQKSENLGSKKSDTLFRYYIWRDMAREYGRYKPFFGFDFGRPLLSSTLYHYKIAVTTQGRDGWIGAHNSFFYIIYRAGVVGLALILGILLIWLSLLRDFYVLRDWTGVLLCAIFLNWMISANFFLIFELPYTAIPVWTILGITLKHRMLLMENFSHTPSF